MLVVLLRPRLHVPLAVATVFAALAHLILHALGVIDLTPHSAAVGTLAIALSSFVSAYAVFVRSTSEGSAYRHALGWPMVISLGAGAVIGVAMPLERPEAVYSFAGMVDLGAVVAFFLCLALGVTASVAVASLVWLLVRLRSLRRSEDQHAFAAITWALACVALTLAHLVRPAAWLDGALGASLLALVGQLVATRGRRASAPPTVGPYRGAAR
jgi:hypothetical protein